MKKVLCFSILLSCICCMFGQTRVIAHRGFWKTAGSAQNSITALLKADSIGCYGSEFDVWLTKDDKLVVNHDSEIQSHKIEESTLKVLTNLKLSNGENVPSLVRFLSIAKKNTRLKLILELKEHSTPKREEVAIRKIIRLVGKMRLEDRVEYITFSSYALKELIRTVPEGIPVYYLRGELPPQELKNIGSAGPDYNINVFRRHTDWIDECHDFGLKANVWTVDKVEDMEEFIGKADFITTDDPVKAMEISKISLR